ncbi:hypothetical protein [Rhizorhabdus argentea]|uniref:hypothetical protein n=1 Tax=Rhizorhabdus argentea TaxID=1387174 RepID=UPI0030EC396F
MATHAMTLQRRLQRRMLGERFVDGNPETIAEAFLGDRTAWDGREMRRSAKKNVGQPMNFALDATLRKSRAPPTTETIWNFELH